jgi:hypothetical protein
MHAMNRFLIVGAVVALASAGVTTAGIASASSPHATMIVSPTALAPVAAAFNGISGCSTASSCQFKITETAGSNAPILWDAQVMTSPGYGPFTFTPASGTLHPGNTVSVKVNGNGLCNDQGFGMILIFGTYGPLTGSRNTANAIALMAFG